MVKERDIKVVVGLTNSADSKVAAYLLNQQGYEVMGVTFLYGHKEKAKGEHSNLGILDYKCNISDSKEIKNFCQKLGIQHFVFFAQDEYRDEVVDTCISYHLKSANDNPCFGCSKLTLGLLLEKAVNFGADFISTGHYAKVHFSQTSKTYFLNAANEMTSDQSFLLANIRQDILAKLILPLGDLRKVEVQKIADRQGWDCPKSDDSKVCLTSGGLNKFMDEVVPKSLIKGGNILFYNDDLSVGTHEGLHLQNFGERFNGTLYPTTAPGDYVVVDINRYKGDVFIEKRENIFCKRIFLNDIKLRKTAVFTKPKQIIIKIEKSPITYSGIIHFKNNNSCLIILDKKINKLLPSGTDVTIYEKLIGGRLSVLGSGRVK